MRRPLALAIAVAPALLCACAAGPNYHRPALSPSASLGELATAPATAASAQALTPGMDIPAQWWRLFHCADLDTLVAEALSHNASLEAAKAALRAADEQVRAQRGAYFPSMGLSLQPSRQSVAATLSSPTQSGTNLYSLTTTQVSVSYAPDLFGANRRAVESLVAQRDEQRFELEAARVSLASNVVTAAIQDALLREQIKATQLIIDDQKQILASFEQQARLGQASQADLAAQQALLAQAEAALPALDKSFRVNRDLLAALVGRTPGENLEVAFDFQALGQPEALPISLPAQIVEHRPDVRIAEAQLRAASANVGVAAAARWPSLQIDANAGSAALGLTPSFSSAANFWNIAATLTQPVFDGGILLHRERAARAAYDQAAAQYQATVVGAFQNTADVLHALWTDGDALAADQAAQVAAARSLDIARRQLGLGDVNRLAVLGAEQAEAQARLTLLQARANRYADAAALFQALGGGWWNQDATADAAGTRLSRR